MFTDIKSTSQQLVRKYIKGMNKHTYNNYDRL